MNKETNKWIEKFRDEIYGKDDALFNRAGNNVSTQVENLLSKTAQINYESGKSSQRLDVSTWKEIGKKYGYDKFFEGKIKAEIVEKIDGMKKKCPIDKRDVKKCSCKEFKKVCTYAFGEYDLETFCPYCGKKLKVEIYDHEYGVAETAHYNQALEDIKKISREVDGDTLQEIVYALLKELAKI